MSGVTRTSSQAALEQQGSSKRQAVDQKTVDTPSVIRPRYLFPTKHPEPMCKSVVDRVNCSLCCPFRLMERPPLDIRTYFDVGVDDNELQKLVQTGIVTVLHPTALATGKPLQGPSEICTNYKETAHGPDYHPIPIGEFAYACDHCSVNGSRSMTCMDCVNGSMLDCNLCKDCRNNPAVHEVNCGHYISDPIAEECDECKREAEDEKDSIELECGCREPEVPDVQRELYPCILCNRWSLDGGLVCETCGIYSDGVWICEACNNQTLRRRLHCGCISYNDNNVTQFFCIKCKEDKCDQCDALFVWTTAGYMCSVCHCGY